jgi:hypothetical protein
MGNLRAKAKRELDADREAVQKAAEERVATAKAAHEERAGPVAEWLSTWADMHVSPDQLEPSNSQSGPPTYNIELDGFKLAVEGVGKPPEDLHVAVWQYSPDGMLDREVQRPADLLAAWPVDPPPAKPTAPGNYTRELLIGLCEDGSVPESEWYNRDSERAQRQLGEALMLLRAGCEFTINPDTDAKAVWIDTISKGFQYVECGELRYDHFYIPTRSRLDRAAGDWY